MRRWCFVASLLAAFPTPAFADAPPSCARPSSASSRGTVDARLQIGRATTRAVLIRLDPRVTASAGASVHLDEQVETVFASHGVSLRRARDGGALGHASTVTAKLTSEQIDRLAHEPFVESITLDGSFVETPQPLDHTASLVSAELLRGSEGAVDFGITGRGITICNIDAGIDVLHPSFFNADGGYVEWRDENGNSVLDTGGDAVIVDGVPVVLRSLNGIVSHFADEVPLFDTQLSMLDLRYDYFYADLDDNLQRDAGRAAGFTDASPSLGEPMFVGDDVNGNGLIDLGEKIVMLGTSKIRAFRVGEDVYRRGENLIDAPWTEDMQHGNGASGILVGGHAGLGTLVGIAPDADLVVAAIDGRGQEFAMTTFCLDEGARVVLHEYAPWIGFHLDGSSELEALIDESTELGVSHVNPAGNLSGSQKSAKFFLEPGAPTVAPLDLPANGATAVALTFLWRDSTRDLGFELVDPLGQSFPLDLTGVARPWSGRLVQSIERISDRGTRSMDVYVWSAAELATGRWEVRVEDAEPADEALTVVGFAYDNRSGWKPGFVFTENVSEDHLIGWPGTADHGLVVGAYRGHAFEDGPAQGERAEYSGRGHRIDGASLLAMSAPDNPIVPGRFEHRELAYVIYGGTSGASPHVAGAAALLLAEDPTLDGRQVKARIAETARADEATGVVPNDDFGYGKLDVYRAVTGASLEPGAGPHVEELDYVVPIGKLTTLPIIVSDDDDDRSELRLEVDLDYDGVFDQTLADPWVNVFLDEHNFQVIKVRATDPAGRQSSALMRVHTDQPPAVSINEGRDDAIDLAGGCRTSPTSSRSPWLMFAVGLLAVRRRSGLLRAQPNTTKKLTVRG